MPWSTLSLSILTLVLRHQGWHPKAATPVTLVFRRRGQLYSWSCYSLLSGPHNGNFLYVGKRFSTLLSSIHAYLGEGISLGEINFLGPKFKVHSCYTSSKLRPTMSSAMLIAAGGAC